MAWPGSCSGGLCSLAWVGAVIVVMLRVLGQDLAKVLFAMDQQVVEHSRRSVLTYRSAKEFAWGDRTGVLMIRMPFPAKTSSNIGVNLLSRSRIRNLKRPARSPRSMSRLRACCAVHAPVGLAVTPRMCTRRVSI